MATTWLNTISASRQRAVTSAGNTEKKELSNALSHYAQSEVTILKKRPQFHPLLLNIYNIKY